jgi:hypothetical protein
MKECQRIPDHRTERTPEPLAGAVQHRKNTVKKIGKAIGRYLAQTTKKQAALPRKILD